MLKIEGNIVYSNKISRGRIEIGDDGIITKVAEPIGEADVLLKDELIFPGFIDLHVHAREDMSHTQEYKEDFTTAGEAGINGGVVAFADMPNNVMPPVDDISYDEKNELAKKCPITVLLYAGIGSHTHHLNKKVPYKVFMGPSIGDLFFKSNEELEEKIKLYEGQNVSFHCEDPKILEENKDRDTHEEKRPAVAENSAVDFALMLIEKYNLIGKICHASTIEAIEKIAVAKAKGLKVTVEVTPHHLFFDETIFNKNSRTMFQVNPPIRQTKENRLALIEALRTGKIDYIATDHAPHSVEEKAKGMSGLTHLDTFGPFMSWLMTEHNFSAQDILRVCSKNPADFINEFDLTPTLSWKGEGESIKLKFGEIKEGFIGSLTILDLHKPFVVTSDKLKTKCHWSPFLGVKFPGSVTMTVIKGKVFKK